MKQNKNILAIHIDDDSLNIVHLRHTAKGLQIQKWTSEPLAADVMEDGLIVDGQTIARKVRAFTKANRLHSCKAIMSTSCSSVRLRPCEFPEQSDEQLQKQVEEQIEKYSLFEGKEVVFDYCTFDQQAWTSNKQTVLQAITTRQMSDACMSIAEKAGLKLERIEPSIMPIIKLALDKQTADSQTVWLLLVLDSASGNLTVFKNGEPRLCQNLSVGTKDVLEGADGFARLAEEMKPVLGFARSISESPRLVLTVAGACDDAKLETIVEQVRQSVGDAAVEQMDCSSIAREFELQGAAGDIPIFPFASALTALGVCQFEGQLNLTSQESLTRRKTKKEMSFTGRAIAVVVVLSIAALFLLKMQIETAETASAEVEAKVAKSIPMRDRISGLRGRINRLRRKLPAYHAIEKDLIDIPWAKVMQTIGDALPDKLRISDISTTNSGQFTLRGQALGEGRVYKFVKALQSDELVESANVEKIESDNRRDATLVCYTITCKLQMAESDL